MLRSSMAAADSAVDARLSLRLDSVRVVQLLLPTILEAASSVWASHPRPIHKMGFEAEYEPPAIGSFSGSKYKSHCHWQMKLEGSFQKPAFLDKSTKDDDLGFI
jgi:hypothetical protein